MISARPDEATPGQLASRNLSGQWPLWALLAAAPWVLMFLFKVALHPRPFWAFYYDPEAIYFFEGLDPTRFRVLGTFDRPGAPVQLLSALISLARGSDALDFDGFRSSAYWCILALAVGGCAFLASIVLRGVQGPQKLVCVWGFLAFPQAFEYMMVWSPEALFFPMGAVALGSLQKIELEPDRRGPRFLAGLAIGSLCALKLTFIPWLVGAVFASLATRDLAWRRQAGLLGALVGGVVLSFSLWTAHMLPKFGDLLAWIWRILSRSGEYGSGVEGLPSATGAVGNLLAVMTSAKGAYLLLAGLVVSLLGSQRQRGVGYWANDGQAWMLRFILAAAACSLLLAVRQPVSRYYLPIGLLVVLLLRSWYLHERKSPRRYLGRALGLFVVGLATKQAVLDTEAHRARIAAERELQGELLQAVDQLSPGSVHQSVVWSFRAPLPSYALHSMSRSEEDHDKIFEAYPLEGFLEWSGRIRLPSGATDWGLLVLQDTELSRLSGLCSGGADIGRFTVFRREECPDLTNRIPPAELPKASRPESADRAGKVSWSPMVDADRAAGS